MYIVLFTDAFIVFNSEEKAERAYRPLKWAGESVELIFVDEATFFASDYWEV